MRINSAPTQIQEIDDVLGLLIRGIHEALGDNLIGAYLQGSFAVGDFDDNSDVDFIVVIQDDIQALELPILQALHERIYNAPTGWAKHLEGSYVPQNIWRRCSEEPRDPPGEPRDQGWADPAMGGTSAKVYPFYFLSNGARALVRSEHDNSQVVRWVMRERGITLCGPHPSELIDPVSSEQLRKEIAMNLPIYAAPYIADQTMLNQRWLAAFFVVLYCRMLHTLETGEVRSKKAGVQWAIPKLGNRWSELIKNAWEIRFEKPEVLTHAPTLKELADTVAFLRYVTEPKS